MKLMVFRAPSRCAPSDQAPPQRPRERWGRWGLRSSQPGALGQLGPGPQPAVLLAAVTARLPLGWGTATTPQWQPQGRPAAPSWGYSAHSRDDKAAVGQELRSIMPFLRASLCRAGGPQGSEGGLGEVRVPRVLGQHGPQPFRKKGPQRSWGEGAWLVAPPRSGKSRCRGPEQKAHALSLCHAGSERHHLPAADTLASPTSLSSPGSSSSWPNPPISQKG